MIGAAQRCALAFVVAAALGAAAAPAEWLVTRDGARLEIAGPHEVKGRQVLFELPNGTLGVLRLEEVDLEASAALSRAEKAPEPRSPAPPRRARLVISNDDIPQAPPAPPVAAAGEATSERAATPFLAGLQVTSWEDVDSTSISGLEIRGVLANDNDAAASDLSLVVRLFGEDGEEIASSSAFLDGRAVPARRQIGFRALFEGVYSFARAEFDVEATELRLGVASVGK